MRTESSPTSVTVFTDRARVTRTAKLTLDTGVQLVEFTDLPLSLVSDSVRASGRGAAQAVLLGVSTSVENFVETPAASARDLEAKLQNLQDQDADLSARAATLTQEQSALNGLAVQAEMFARGIALRNRTADEQTQMFAALFKRHADIADELLGVARQRRELKKQIDQAQADLNQLRAMRPRQRAVAAVELDVRTAGELELELSYVVTGASWVPQYDLRHTDDALSVAYLAQVRQTTGEDWRNVSLTLSTAQPQLSLEVPELEPWYVMASPPPMPVARPMVARARGAPEAMMMPAAAPMAMAEPMQTFEMRAEAAVVSDSGASVSYDLPARADVPGSGDPRKVTVGVFDLKPQVDYVTAPKREAVAYRRATVKNTSAFTLLPGSAQLFDGEAYLGATDIELTAPGQDIELVLGSDPRVKVERELSQRQVDKTLLGGNRRIRFGYVIKLENARAQAVSLVVRDQLPVSRDEQIKVKLEVAEPKPSEQDKLNLLEWKLSLAAHAKQTIRFEFTVEYPQAMDVMGLP